MLTVIQACKPRPSVFDLERRDTVLDLPDLTEDRIDPYAFFAENYVTEGMTTLLKHGFERLEGRSGQGVFQLKQAMGGGKTHNLLALGLLARHPQLRAQVMGGFHEPSTNLGPVRVAAFSGRETDAPLGIWGSIADQLGRRSVLSNCYSPLAAPGRSAWIKLLKGDPLLLLLDELPPYFDNAASVTIGNSDLARVTTTALANLLVAIASDKLPKVCLVLTDLTGVYEGGSARIQTVLQLMEKETQRVATPVEPIRLASDEFYHILRKRIFSDLPDESTIREVAEAYGAAVREAKQMDVTTTSPDDFAFRVRSSYPFHPGIRDLYARFRENPGFQQTRALIRLMRAVVARMWETKTDRYLIGPHSLDLTDTATESEIRLINATLTNAIAHDITDSVGGAQAQQLDKQLGTGTDAQDIMRLLLVASLASVPKALKGLSSSEIVDYLCEPGRDVAGIGQLVDELRTRCWYLHHDGQGRLYLRKVQNLNARVRSIAQSYLRDQAIKDLRTRLDAIFVPGDKRCYQRVLAFPAIDDIELSQDNVTLIVSEPASAVSGRVGLSEYLKAHYDDATFQNRVCFLTGEAQGAYTSLLDRARDVKAIEQVIAEMQQEGTPESDPQLQEARDTLLPQFLHRFHSAIRETFTTLYYPLPSGLTRADLLMEFTENKFDGAEQVRKILGQKQKYTEDTTTDTFRKKAEKRLFALQATPWSEVVRQAAISPAWQWHPPWCPGTAQEALRTPRLVAGARQVHRQRSFSAACNVSRHPGVESGRQHGRGHPPDPCSGWGHGLLERQGASVHGI